jgi:hypothetical protein
MPLVIEIVDAEEKINAFLPTLDAMMQSGLITLEKVQVLQIRGGHQSRACLTGFSWPLECGDLCHCG